MQHNWKRYTYAGGYAIFCRSCGEKWHGGIGFECNGPNKKDSSSDE